MKGLFLATTVATVLCLFFFLAAPNHHARRGLRVDPAAIHAPDETTKAHLPHRKQAHYHRRRSLQEVTLTKDSVDPKLGTALTQLYQDSLREGSDAPEVDEDVAIDITFKTKLDNASAKKFLLPAVAVEFISCFQYMCSTRVPVSALPDISNLDAVQVVRLVKAMTNAGSVTSEGDKAIWADVARTSHSVDGSGILIGVLSDSYDSYGDAAADIASGDLPSAGSIIVVQDYWGEDEGRAMMQVIHDVAPGARLAFRTAWVGHADFAAGILLLAQLGCDIIVDDVIYIDEPMFQDGVIAQAVNQVVAQGIPYFSAAGNRAKKAWDAPSGFDPVTVGSGRVLHKFSTDVASGKPITRMKITLSGSYDYYLVFQWDQPFKSASGTVGSQSDIDVFLFLNGKPYRQSYDNNIAGGDPMESLDVYTDDTSPVTFELEIQYFAGPNPGYMKLIVHNGAATFEFPTNLGTSYGHSNAASAAGVGAAHYLKTPAFGVAPPVIESFSSAGGVPIIFSKEGNRLPSKEVRNQPRFTGPDGGVTTFFGRFEDDVYRYYGTSAAASHVAGVAALMLQLRGGRRSLTPAQIYSTLQTTAVDMDDPFTPGFFDTGFDFGTGYGLVNAQKALQALDCSIKFDLFNAQTDTRVATLTNGVTVASPPPCGQANIEAVVPCGDSDGKVTIELYQGSKKIRKATDSGVPYFLFGNSGADVKNGKIKKGSYSIRAQVNGAWSPWISFTLGGSCS